MTSPDGFIELHAARAYPVILLISAVDRRIVPALRFVSRLPFAQSMALHVSVDPDETHQVAEAWMALGLTWLPLHIRDGSVMGVAASVAALVEEEAPSAEDVTVVVPELNLPRWWEPLLHRRTARSIAGALQAAPRVTPVIVPFTASRSLARFPASDRESRQRSRCDCDGPAS